MKSKSIRNLSILGAIVFTANAAHAGPVTQTANDVFGTPAQASFIDSARWSNLAAPSAGNSYFTNGWVFRTPAVNTGTVTFAGDSLSVDTRSTASGTPGATVITKGTASQTISFPNLIMNGGIFSQGENGYTHTLAGVVTANATSGFSITDSSTRNLFVSAPISGAGRLHVGSFGQYNAGDPNYVPTAFTSTFAVSGDNSLFSGGWTLGGGYDAPVFGGAGTYRLNFNASGITFRLGHANALGTGTLELNAGTLNLNGFSPTGLAGVTVPDAASATIRTAGNTLTAAAVTLGSTSASLATLKIDNAGLANPTAAPIASTTLTVNGPSTLSVLGTGLAVGTFPLISHTGAIAGASGFSGITLALPPGVNGIPLDNPGSLDVQINSIEFIKWTGAINGNWNINTTDTNWKTTVGLADTTYQQNAAGGNSVLFNESEAAASPVAIAVPATVSPNAITINNPTKDYIFSGPGGISGTAAFVKDGAGTVTFSNTLGCTGGTTINGGEVVLSGPSPAGTTVAPVATTIASGATLEYSSASGINQGSNAYTGAGKILKSGIGTFVFNGGNSTLSMASGSMIDVQGGRFQLGNDGTQGSTTIGNLADLNLATGTIFDGHTVTVNVDSFTGTGTYMGGYYGPRGLNVGQDGGSGVFSGAIKSNKAGNDTNSQVQFIKRGNGSQTLDGVLAIRGAFGSSSLEVRGGTTLSPSTFTFSPVADTAQIETLSNSGTVGTAGNATATIRAAGLAGSPLAIPFAVASGDTAAAWTQKLRDALNANAAVTSMFSVGGTGADVVLTKLNTEICDFTLNLGIATGTASGITGRNSTNTHTGASSIGYTGGGIYMSPGANDVTVINQTSGTLVGSVVAVGEFGQATYNLSGGTINAGRIEFGWNGGGNNGPVVMDISNSARVNVNSNGQILMGQYNGRQVTINQSGGEVIQFSDAGVTRGGTGKMNFFGNNQNLVWNLSGGTLSIAGMGWAAAGGGAGGGNGVLNLNGGILQITNAAFAAPIGTANGKPVVAAKVQAGTTRLDNYGLEVTFAAPIQHDSTTGVFDGGLKLDSSVLVPSAGSLTLSGINTYTGDTIIPADNTLILADNAELTFLVDGTDATKLTGAGTATLAGDFRIDTAYADTTPGTEWTLVDVTSRTFDPLTFQVIGFSESGDVWTKTADGNKWTFTESTGKLSVAVAPPGYETWIDTLAFGLTVGQKGATDDPDNDGMENLLEYVLNGDPSLSDPAILPDVDSISDPLYLVFTFTRREESATDTTQVFEYGTDLEGWIPVAITGTPGAGVTIGAASGGLEPITVKIPKSAAGSGGKLFGRLNTTKP